MELPGEEAGGPGRRWRPEELPYGIALNQGLTMRLSPVAVASLLILATIGCTVQSGSPLPSPWARTYPDASPVSSGRVVRFGGYYGLMGPSPAVVMRDANGTVSGQVLVWYRRYDPIEAGGNPAADSAAQWGRMQSAMAADRAKFDSTYGCTSWAKGDQEGKAWVCRVPEQRGPVNWAAQLARVDSLAMASRAVEQAGGRRGDPVAPPPPQNPGVTPMRRRDGACMDGGSWYIQTRDTRGAKVIVSPQPGGGCPQPDGPAKVYDQAGWQMLKEFIAAVR